MDMGLRIKSMEKAMTDVIIPALQGSRGLAIEQAHFLLFHLRLIGSQFDKELHLQLAELREVASFAKSLLESRPAKAQAAPEAQKLKALLAQCAPVADLEVPAREHVVALATRLKEAADGMLREELAAQDGTRRARATMLAMEYAARDITRRRIWVREAGYDLEAETLPPIEEVLR